MPCFRLPYSADGVIRMYQRLRDLREDRDWTQKELAAMLGMSQTGYSKYETGENDIPTSILLKLADKQRGAEHACAPQGPLLYMQKRSENT